MTGNYTRPNRTLVPQKFNAITPQRVEWLIDGFIPRGAITLLSGREGLGKSLLSLHWVAQLTRGELTPYPENALIIASEDSASHVIRPRLDAAGADTSRVSIVEVYESGFDAGGIEIPLDIAGLRRIITDEEISLIVIDPLASVMSGQLDTHKDASVRQALDPLNRLAADTQVALLCLMHQNKGQGSDLNTRVTGSRAFVAAARANIAVLQDPDDESLRIAALAKSNLATLDVSAKIFSIESCELITGAVGRVKMQGERKVSLNDLASPDEDKSEVLNSTAWLKDYLISNGGSALKQDVEKAGRVAGYSPDQLKRARPRGGVRVERENKAQARTIWTLNV